MNPFPHSHAKRDEWLRLYGEALDRRADAAEKGDEAAAIAYLAEARACERAYFDGLPRLAMSCCPFDHLPLRRSFDPFGLDGPWWQRDSQRPDPPACPHFCVLRGAVHFGGQRRRGGGFEAHTGPEVPYVIPRLLELPTLVAVLGRLEMEPGYTAYTIAYFAERVPPAEQLAAGWPDTIHSFTSAQGERGWRSDGDAWDFDLEPWIRRGKLRWCEPGSHNAVLSTAPAASCPYLALEGRRERLVVQDDERWSDGVP